MERYAIINVSGLQFKVVPDAVVRVPKLASEVGQEIGLSNVLLFSDGRTVEVGTPYLEGKEIRAEIIRHGRGKKIIVFKKKRRKDYQRKNGHRQQFTEIRIRNFPA
jgi:large subunit ribosomal protein L21